MVLKYTKEPNIVCVSYIIVCVHLNKNISDLKMTQSGARRNVCRLRTFKF